MFSIGTSNAKPLLIEPPHPVKSFYYRCEPYFCLNEVEKLYNVHNYWGLILVSGKETQYYKISQNDTIHLKTVYADLPNQHKCGGQSQHRYERITQEKRAAYVQKLAERAILYYTLDGQPTMTGLILAGPAEIKSKLSETGLISQYFPSSSQKLKLIDTPEITMGSIHEILPKCTSIIDPIDDPIEKKAIDEFKDLLKISETIDKVVFGKNEVVELLENYQISKLLIDEELDDEQINILLGLNNKTTVVRIKNKSFIKSYGNLVGIKWY